MELPHIGQNCTVCNRNDYLPFKCSHCDKIVCVDHRTDHGAECPLDKSTFQYDGPPAESLKKACDHCKRITLKLELTQCSHCNRNHCLHHRHQVQHECQQLARDKEVRDQERQAQSERQKEALARLSATMGDKKAPNSSGQQVGATKLSLNTRINTIKSDPKKQALAKKLRVMKIKQTARGPPNISDQDRVYFEVKFVHEPRSSLSNSVRDGKSIRIFTSGKHTIGRMIDWSASELDVTNKNHLEQADQLVFKQGNHLSDDNCDGQALILDSQLNFQHYLDAGQLDNGDELVLTYLSS